MNAVKTFGAAMIVVGILTLAYGTFSYKTETHSARIGSLDLSVSENKTVNVPVWAGVFALAAGGFLLLVPRTS